MKLFISEKEIKNALAKALKTDRNFSKFDLMAISNARDWGGEIVLNFKFSTHSGKLTLNMVRGVINEFIKQLFDGYRSNWEHSQLAYDVKFPYDRIIVTLYSAQAIAVVAKK